MTEAARPMPYTSLRDLQELQADPALIAKVQRQFLAWLDAPEHQALQMRSFLFGRGGKCCALGGLAHVLAETGFASVDVDALQVVFKHRGKELSRWPITLPHEVGSALGWQLGWISNLNDEGGRTFAQVAQKIRDTEADHQTLPF